MVPLQMVADAGLTVATNWLTVSVAGVLKSTAVQGPSITARNWYPFMLSGALVNVMVFVVAPVYTPVLLKANHDAVAEVLYCHL